MKPREIPYKNLLAQSIYNNAMKYPGGSDNNILSIIKENVIDEKKKIALKYSLQVGLCINFNYCKKIKSLPEIRYQGNFYHYAISNHLNEHLTLLKEHDLIPEEVIPMEHNTVGFCPKISPLATAVRFKNHRIAEELLIDGENVNQCDFHTKQSLLEIASQLVNYEMIDLLLKYRANPNSPNSALDAALSEIPADESERTKVVKLFIKHGANILLTSIQDKIKRQSDFITYEKKLFSILERETKERSNFKYNMSLLLFGKKDDKSAVRDVPKEIFGEIIRSTWNG